MQLVFSLIRFFHKSVIVFIFTIGLIIPNYILAQDIQAMLIAETDSTSYRLKAVENHRKYLEFFNSGDFEQSRINALKGVKNMYQYNKLVNDSTIYPVVILQSKLFRAYAVSSFYRGDYIESLSFYDRVIENLNVFAS